MILGLFLSLAGRWGLAGRLQRVAAWVMGIAAFIALLGLLWGGGTLAWHHWLGRHDKQVIAVDRQKANDQVSAMVNTADAVAGNAQLARDTEFNNSQAQLKEKADAAADNGDSPLDALFNQLR